MDFRVGCSGWSYKHWRGTFYPWGVSQKRWFEHYAREFDTVELNNTFYRLPTEHAVRHWAESAPEGFAFAIKVSRLITHYHRLRDSESALGTFFERMEPLVRRAGPFLYQLPPQFERDDERLGEFLRLLPAGRIHAFEFRHASWWAEPVYELLRRHGAAFVMWDLAGTRTPAVATGHEAYLRMHGPAKYSETYRDPQLAAWVEAARGLEGVRRTWVYFNNDIGGHAPDDARRFREMVAR